MVGIIARIVSVLLAAITLAPKLGVYRKVSTAFKTFSRVDLTTRSGEFKHRETVAVETPAVFATSSSVGVDRFEVIVSLFRFLDITMKVNGR